MATVVAPRLRGSWIAGIALLVAVAWAAPAVAPAHSASPQPTARPQLETNQTYIEEAQRAASGLDLADPKAMLAFVLAGLPERVKVYPTENYFYFKFYHGHERYAGNVRLDVTDRDEGKVNFAYFKDLTEWSDQAPVKHVLFSAKDGVRVEKLGPLLYKVGIGAREVVFELNDLSGVRPSAGVLSDKERYIGPVFDESGIQFLLVYNGELKLFHYILDERVPHEPLVPSRVSDRILIGQRTGFAYFRDHKLPRKILIGIHEANARVNNYFDGPFDQLPDNFIEGEALRSAIIEVEPRLEGKIDRLGISPGGADRYMIAPYAHFRNEEELMTFHACAISKDVPASHYHACFVIDPDATPEDGNAAAAAPLAQSPAQKSAPSPAQNAAPAQTVKRLPAPGTSSKSDR